MHEVLPICWCCCGGSGGGGCYCCSTSDCARVLFFFLFASLICCFRTMLLHRILIALHVADTFLTVLFFCFVHTYILLYSLTFVSHLVCSNIEHPCILIHYTHIQFVLKLACFNRSFIVSSLFRLLFLFCLISI